MKRLLLTTLLLCALTTLYSQERVGLVEVEAALGLVGGKAHAPFSESKAGAAAAEVRVNMPNSPFDVGLQLAVVRYGRESTLFRHNHTTLFADYNLRPHHLVHFFAGVGVGYGEVIEGAYSTNGEVSSYSHHLVVAPRLGVEFCNIARLTLESKLLSQGKSYVGATLGVVIGGWRKK